MSNDETDSDSLMEGLPVQWIKEEAVLWVSVGLNFMIYQKNEIEISYKCYCETNLLFTYRCDIIML